MVKVHSCLLTICNKKLFKKKLLLYLAEPPPPCGDQFDVPALEEKDWMKKEGPVLFGGKIPAGVFLQG